MALNTNLHSNMVRFIIRRTNDCRRFNFNIYIPIWLDLLYFNYKEQQEEQKDLHSNMVRFIIKKTGTSSSNIQKFTFQYG